MQTVVHVTHEAIQKIGGIGAVLQGLLTSRDLPRTGHRATSWSAPSGPTDERGEQRLGPQGEVLYSSLDHLYRSPLAARFREIEQTFDVGIVYGRRQLHRQGDRRHQHAGSAADRRQPVRRAARSAQFKFELWEKFGIDSSKYEDIWDFEQYMRLAQPAIAALHALGASSAVEPCVILSHEYMGMPTVPGRHHGRGAVQLPHDLLRPRSGDRCGGSSRATPATTRCSTTSCARRIGQGHYVEDVFGDQSGFYKHALVKAARFCDGIFAVGDYVLKEIRFLGPDFVHVDAQLAYNGVPCWKISVEEKMAQPPEAAQLLQDAAEVRAGLRLHPRHPPGAQQGPVARPARAGAHGAAAPRRATRRPCCSRSAPKSPPAAATTSAGWSRHYHWPVAHREGLPDLSGGEAAYYQGVQEFNAQSRNIKVVFINQFGFEPEPLRRRACRPTWNSWTSARAPTSSSARASTSRSASPRSSRSASAASASSPTSAAAPASSRRPPAAPTPNVIVADYTELPDKSAAPRAADDHRPAAARRDRARGRGEGGQRAARAPAAHAGRSSSSSSSAATPWRRR